MAYAIHDVAWYLEHVERQRAQAGQPCRVKLFIADSGLCVRYFHTAGLSPSWSCNTASSATALHPNACCKDCLNNNQNHTHHTVRCCLGRCHPPPAHSCRYTSDTRGVAHPLRSSWHRRPPHTWGWPAGTRWSYSGRLSCMCWCTASHLPGRWL